MKFAISMQKPFAILLACVALLVFSWITPMGGYAAGMVA